MFGLIGNIGSWELIIILLVAVVVVGPDKLPELVRNVSKVVKDIRNATSTVRKDIEEAFDLEDLLETNPRSKSLKGAIKVAKTEPSSASASTEANSQETDIDPPSASASVEADSQETDIDPSSASVSAEANSQEKDIDPPSANVSVEAYTQETDTDLGQLTDEIVSNADEPEPGK